MSLEIKINGVKVNISKDTVIGYNLTNFDISDISNRSVNYTNSFQIPREGNEMIFGFSNNPSSLSTTPYDNFDNDIYSDGILIVDGGKGYISDSDDGFYTVQVIGNKSLIDDMKSVTLASLTQEVSFGLPSAFTQNLINGTTNYRLDYILNDTTLAHLVSTGDFRNDWYKSSLSVYVKYLFSRYSALHGVTFAGDLMTDSYFLDLRLLMSSCYLANTFASPTVSVVSAKPREADTFYDLFREVMKIFCSTYKMSGTTITISKFDLIDKSNYYDWSDKLMAIESKKYSIEGTGQKNRIRYNAESGASKDLNMVTLDSNNLNIPYEKDLIKIDASVFPFVNLLGVSATSNKYCILTDELEKSNRQYIYPAMGFRGDYIGLITKSLDKFIFICDGPTSLSTGIIIEAGYLDTKLGTVTYYPYTTLSGDSKVIATYYNSSNDYNIITEMLTNPVAYTVKMLFNILDIYQFDNLKPVFIKQLGGLFYINKISDYLLNSTDKSATVELIKM